MKTISKVKYMKTTSNLNATSSKLNQSKSTKPSITKQIYQTHHEKSTKPNLPNQTNQTYETNPIQTNYQTKSAKIYNFNFGMSLTQFYL